MWKAVVVDKDYGSVSLDNLTALRQRFVQADVDLRLEHCTDEEQMIAACGEADAVLATGNPPITARVLGALPRLRLVQRFGIGVDSIDLEASTKAGVLALFMPGFCVEELAHHAASLILSLVRNTVYYDRSIRAGGWPKAGYFIPRSIGSLTLGLYGFGGSARALCDIFHRGFGTRIITCDPFAGPELRAQYPHVTFVELQEFLTRADIVSLHAPLNDETRGMFNREVFRQMKPDSMIINIARGGLINEDDLIEALQSGEIRFAGLDVFQREPVVPDNPLLQMNNVVLTCHSAFYGEQAMQTQLNLAFRLVEGVLRHGTVPRQYVANRDVLERIELKSE